MKIRVYYEDTDYGQVVYYANYLRFMERSRTEYLRERGIDLVRFHGDGLVFVVINASVNYRHAARYDDLLDVTSFPVERSSLTITFETTILNQNNQVCVEGRVRMVCVRFDTGKTCKLPPELQALEIVPGKMKFAKR